MYKYIKEKKNTLNDLKYFTIPDGVENLLLSRLFFSEINTTETHFTILTFFNNRM